MLVLPLTWTCPPGPRPSQLQSCQEQVFGSRRSQGGVANSVQECHPHPKVSTTQLGSSARCSLKIRVRGAFALAGRCQQAGDWASVRGGGWPGALAWGHLRSPQPPSRTTPRPARSLPAPGCRGATAVRGLDSFFCVRNFSADLQAQRLLPSLLRLLSWLLLSSARPTGAPGCRRRGDG